MASNAQEQNVVTVLEADPRFEIETGTGRLRLTAGDALLVFAASYAIARTLRGPARRPDGRASAGQPGGVRKVRAPQRRVAGNARPP